MAGSNRTVISDLLGGAGGHFRGSTWPEDLALFHSNPAWFDELSSIGALRDPEEWLDRAHELQSFGTRQLFARSEARRRYAAGETIYILGLDRTVKPLRELCAGLAADLALSPSYVTVEAWAAGGATSVGMHYDHDYNFNIQIIGRKEWQSAPNDLVANPIATHLVTDGKAHVATASGRAMPTEMPSDARTWVAAPGDVVYLPRGVWHATRTTEATFAMAFVVKPPTWGHHVTTTLLDRLHADARWRERVLGGRDLTQHARLKGAAREALEAARAILDQIGPSEMLYPSLWGRKPAYLRRADGMVDVRFEASSGILSWRLGDTPGTFTVPAWARLVAEHMAGAAGNWYMADLHDLVGGDDVPALKVLIAELSSAGFLELAPAALGGVAAAAATHAAT